MKEKNNGRGWQTEKYGTESRRALQMMGKKRKRRSGNHRIRGALAVTLAFAAGMFMVSGSVYGVQAQERTRICDAAMRPSASAPDNGGKMMDRFVLWEGLIRGNPRLDDNGLPWEEAAEEAGDDAAGYPLEEDEGTAPDEADEESEGTAQDEADGEEENIPYEADGEEENIPYEADGESEETVQDETDGESENTAGEEPDEDAAGTEDNDAEEAGEDADEDAADENIDNTETVYGVIDEVDAITDDPYAQAAGSESASVPETLSITESKAVSEDTGGGLTSGNVLEAAVTQPVLSNPEPAAEEVVGRITADDKEDTAIFTGDTTEPEILISGVEDGRGYSGEVAAQIEVYDRNFSDCEITLTRTRLDEIDVDVTELFFDDWELSERGGEILGSALERTPENDGIYTLRVRVSDEAGNESEETVTFSVNRFGSVYVFSDYLVSLIRDGGMYTQEITEDLVITEYNVDKLVDGSRGIDITRDGKPVENVMCERSDSGDGWHEYRYTIDKRNFDRNGVYKMTLYSLDEAGNVSDAAETTGWEILFRVDNAAPEIIGNAKTDESGFLAEGENFEYNIYDTMGLASVDVYLNGETLCGKITDFGDDLNNCRGIIAVDGSPAEQEIRIVATDLAGNETDASYSLPAGVYTLRQAIASPGAALEDMAGRGTLIPCILGASAAAAVLLIMSGVRKPRRRR